MRQTKMERWGGRACRALLLGLSLGALSACDDLLEVEIPHLLTDEAIQPAASAELQVMSAMGLYECGMAAFSWVAMGHEDVVESIAGVAGTAHRYRNTPVTGTCGSGSSQAWFDQIIGARALISTDAAKFPGLSDAQGAGAGVYDRINGEWALAGTQSGERLSAIAAIYMAASLQHFGQYFCEGALDGSAGVDPDGFLAMADAWIGRALGHVANVTGSDFAMPNNAASSARNMALGLRAQIALAQGNLTAAAGYAQDVLDADPDFTAYVTREAGETRENRVYSSRGFSGMDPVNTWWDGPNRLPNPATGTTWPDTIPFTGYLFLGVMPDGRTLEAGTNAPVTWAEALRDADEDPVPLANGAVADTRVQTIYATIQGSGKWDQPNKYTDAGDDMPLVSWRELTLIVAMADNAGGNQADAIDAVNELRDAASLPDVSGAYYDELTDGTNDQAEVRALILEELRRELFTESGRWWAWKIQNTDMLWFPRNQGTTPGGGYQYLGGVRLPFPNDEYQLNTHFTNGLDDRGTLCATAERPIF